MEQRRSSVRPDEKDRTSPEVLAAKTASYNVQHILAAEFRALGVHAKQRDCTAYAGLGIRVEREPCRRQNLKIGIRIGARRQALQSRRNRPRLRLAARACLVEGDCCARAGWFIAGGRISPWAVRVEDAGLAIAGQNDVDDQRLPTAREAACYLARLCRAYDLGSQCSAALAAALTLPLHASTTPFKSAIIELPRPSFSRRMASPGLRDFPTDFGHLDYYMSFSLSLWILGSSLWGTFWEPDVPCNFADAWLGPIAAILDPIIGSDDLELLVKVLSTTTNMAPLWLGLVLCGRRAIVNSILPSLTELRDYPHSRPDIDAAAWTGMPQSFMDIRPPGPYVRQGMVSRADIWRLRHDFYEAYEDGTFLYMPPHGWPPFGEMREEDVQHEIRARLRYRHQWKYEWWTWLPDGVTDCGFTNDCPMSHSWDGVLGMGWATPNARLGDQHHPQGFEASYGTYFWWCCSQVEGGFGGTLVKPRHGYNNVPELESSEGHDSADPETIHKWLQTVEVCSEE